MAVVTLKIAGVVLVFDPVGLQSFDYPKSLLSRGTEWILVGLVLLAVLRFGTAVVPGHGCTSSSCCTSWRSPSPG